MSHLLSAEPGVLGRPSYAGDGVSSFSSSASGAGPAGAGSGAGAGGSHRSKKRSGSSSPDEADGDEFVPDAAVRDLLQFTRVKAGAPRNIFLKVTAKYKAKLVSNRKRHRHCLRQVEVCLGKGGAKPPTMATLHKVPHLLKRYLTKEALDAFVSQREAHFASFQQQQREMLIRQYKLVVEGLDATFSECQVDLRELLITKFNGLVTTHLDLAGTKDRVGVVDLLLPDIKEPTEYFEYVAAAVKQTVEAQHVSAMCKHASAVFSQSQPDSDSDSGSTAASSSSSAMDVEHSDSGSPSVGGASTHSGDSQSTVSGDRSSGSGKHHNRGGRGGRGGRGRGGHHVRFAKHAAPTAAPTMDGPASGVVHTPQPAVVSSQPVSILKASAPVPSSPSAGVSPTPEGGSSGRKKQGFHRSQQHGRPPEVVVSAPAPPTTAMPTSVTNNYYGASQLHPMGRVQPPQPPLPPAVPHMVPPPPPPMWAYGPGPVYGPPHVRPDGVPMQAYHHPSGWGSSSWGGAWGY